MKRSVPVVCLINLGCPKNTVDAECILGSMVQAGFLVAEDPEDADLCLVNTCGFIESARRETAETLAMLRRLRRRGRPRRIVALGCMVERLRHSPEFAFVLRDADAQVPFSQYARLPELCRALLDERCAIPPTASECDFLSFLDQPRLRIGGAYTAYLKIAEGCSNRCRYCAIPLMRGPQRSRPLDALVGEARQLIEHGAREINLIAQDTTAYGFDLNGEYLLPKLLRQLAGVKSNVWFRLLYAHPAHLTEEIIRILADEPLLCPYLDLPLQHIADDILLAMGRKVTSSRIRGLIELFRNLLPDGGLRTTFIVGFPGETDRHFEELCRFVQEGWFDWVGVFAYSREPGTPAAAEPDIVPLAEKVRRQEQLLRIQRAITARRNADRRGSRERVLVEVSGGRLCGRARFQAPEIDGIVKLRGEEAKNLRPGEFVDCEIVGSAGYDVIARVISSGTRANASSNLEGSLPPA